MVRINAGNFFGPLSTTFSLDLWLRNRERGRKRGGYVSLDVDQAETGGDVVAKDYNMRV